MYQILSESIGFAGRDAKNILCVFSVNHSAEWIALLITAINKTSGGHWNVDAREWTAVCVVDMVSVHTSFIPAAEGRRTMFVLSSPRPHSDWVMVDGRTSFGDVHSLVETQLWLDGQGTWRSTGSVQSCTRHKQTNDVVTTWYCIISITI